MTIVASIAADDGLHLSQVPVKDHQGELILP
jgi:hypothetical protein